MATKFIGKRIIHLPCFLEDELPSLFRLRLSLDLVIPNCEMILPAYVQSYESAILPKHMVVEGSGALMKNKGIVVARVVVDIHQEQIPVRVLCPHEQEVSLQKEPVGFGQTILELREKCNHLTKESHLIPLLDGCRNELNACQLEHVSDILQEFSNIFAKSKMIEGTPLWRTTESTQGGQLPLSSGHNVSPCLFRFILLLQKVCDVLHHNHKASTST